MSKAQFKKASDIDELFTIMNNDPEVLFTYIPLQETPELANTADRLIATNAHIDQLIAPDGRISIYGGVDDLNGTPFAHEDYRTPSAICLRDEFILTKPDGDKFNMNSNILRNNINIPNSSTSMIIQATSDNAVGPKKHQDENALTINFYALGKGVQYHLATNSITIKSPVITAHRGKRHELSSEDDGFSYAVWHNRQDNEGEDINRVNFILGLG